jgi:hypothetical protein
VWSFRSPFGLTWAIMVTAAPTTHRGHERGGSIVADLKKHSRITGTEREKLASELRKQYDAGASIRALAAASGRSYGFVHRILTESGVNMRSRGGATRGRRTATVGAGSKPGP